MSILDTREEDSRYSTRNTVIVFVLVSILTVTVNKVYSFFGHGVSSDAMTYMFLYPLFYGTIFFLVTGMLLPGMNLFKGYRLFYNLYNAGIATITLGSFQKGIMEIAGTDSRYLKLFYGIGYALLGAGILIFLILCVNYRKVKNVSRQKS